MKMYNKLTGIIVGTALLSSTAIALQAERADRSRYYEEDAWYDITEWFDGNDYNPTDEAWYRWDDEKYDHHEDVGNDWDSDVYGYNEGTTTDWFYDYYDDNYVRHSDYDADQTYEFQSHYIDVDNDGAVDAYYSFYDSDADGTLDEVNYISFNQYGESGRASSSSMQSNKNWQQKTSPRSVTGEVTNTKDVTVRNAKHHVVEVKTADGQTVAVDLGNKSKMRDVSVKKGDRITVQGFESKVGDKNVVLAKSITANGQTKKLNRGGFDVTGEVIDTHTATLRGEQHTLALIKKRDGKQCLVDLGPTNKMPATVAKGQSVTVTGVPVKVSNTTLLMATAMERNGEMQDINRAWRSGTTTPRPDNDMNRNNPNERTQPGMNPGAGGGGN